MLSESFLALAQESRFKQYHQREAENPMKSHIKMTNLSEVLKPILMRVNAINVSQRELDKHLTATIYDSEYSFHLDDERIIFTRGSKKSYVELEEIEMIEHVLMPRLKRIDAIPKVHLAKFNASDLTIRLHLLLSGDTFITREKVVFVNSGTQFSEDCYLVE